MVKCPKCGRKMSEMATIQHCLGCAHPFYVEKWQAIAQQKERERQQRREAERKEKQKEKAILYHVKNYHVDFKFKVLDAFIKEHGRLVDEYGREIECLEQMYAPTMDYLEKIFKAGTKDSNEIEFEKHCKLFEIYVQKTNQLCRAYDERFKMYDGLHDPLAPTPKRLQELAAPFERELQERNRRQVEEAKKQAEEAKKQAEWYERERAREKLENYIRYNEHSSSL